MTVEELKVIISAQTSKALSGIKSVKNAVSSLKSHIGSQTKSMNSSIASMGKSVKSVGNSFSSLKRTILGLGMVGLLKNAITSNLDAAIKRADTLNNYAKVMSNLGIGAGAAQASVQKLSQKLMGLPTALDSATSSVQRFTSVNNDISKSTDMFLALNNAILAGGASSDIQKSAMEQLSQAYSKGKPDMMEWRAALTAMPAQMKQIALAMGFVNSTELGEALRKGRVSMDEFMNTVQRLNTEGANGFDSFETQARNATGGIATSITNMKTAITRGIAEVINAIGQSNIAGFFAGIARVINSVVPYIVRFIQVLKIAVEYISLIFGGKSTAKAKATGVSFGGMAKSTGSIASNTGTAASNTNKLGKNASGAGNKIKKAAKNAKKLKDELKGALANFDTLNILDASNSQSGSSSPSGGTGGTGGTGGVGGAGDLGSLGGLDLGDATSALDDLDDKLDGIRDKIAKFFEPLRQSWEQYGSGLIYSVVDTFESIKSLVGHIGESMLTVWGDGSGAETIGNILQIFTNIWNTVGNITTALDAAWQSEETGTKLVHEMWSGFNTVLGIVTDITGQLEKMSRGLDFSGALKNLTATMSVINDDLKLIRQGINDIFNGDVKVGIDNISNGLSDAINLGLRALRDFDYSGAFRTVGNILAEAINLGVSTLKKIEWGAMFEGITKAVIGAFEGVVELVKDINWVDVGKTISNFVVEGLKGINKAILETDWLKLGLEAGEALGKAIFDTVTHIDWLALGVEIIKLIANGFVGTVSFLGGAIFGLFSGAVNGIAGGIGDLFNDLMEGAIGGLKTVTLTIKGAVGAGWQFMVDTWNGIKNSSVVKTISGAIAGAFNTMKSAFNSVANSHAVKTIGGAIQGAFNTAKNAFNALKNGTVTKTFKGAMQGALSKAISAWNAVKSKTVSLTMKIGAAVANIKGWINTNVIGKINKVLPGFFPKIPKLAKGGIVSRSTLANIGEAGTEAVIPLERNTSGIRKIAELLTENIDSTSRGGGTITVNLVVDGKVLASTVVDEVKKEEKMTGVPVFG